jgi:hypothetical protein
MLLLLLLVIIFLSLVHMKYAKYKNITHSNMGLCVNT